MKTALRQLIVKADSAMCAWGCDLLFCTSGSYKETVREIRADTLVFQDAKTSRRFGACLAKRRSSNA